MVKAARKPIGHTIWLKVVLTILFFVPSYTQIAHGPSDIPNVIAAVLSNPLIVQSGWLLPIFKLLLFFVVILSVINCRLSAKIAMGYYAFILLMVGIFQNIANTEAYGLSVIIGNIIVQFAVLGFVLYDVVKGKTILDSKDLNIKRLWLVPLMLFAFLMPYSTNDAGNVYPSLTLNVLYNEAGVTYCMITPIIIGLLLLYSKGVNKATLSVVSYVGFIFGLLNMMTWFVMNADNWWMGVLHLPLLLIAFYGLVVAYKEKPCIRN